MTVSPFVVLCDIVATIAARELEAAGLAPDTPTGLTIYVGRREARLVVRETSRLLWHGMTDALHDAAFALATTAAPGSLVNSVFNCTGRQLLVTFADPPQEEA